MTYIKDDEISALSDDSQQAFVEAEKIMRDRLNDYLSASNISSDYHTLEYMNNVIALANHFGIGEIAEWKRAVPGSHDWLQYRRFAADVDACTMAIRLVSVRRARMHSVALDADAKTKLRQMLDHIRVTVDQLDISVAKKDALIKRVNALQEEVDRVRTRYESFAALLIEACDDAGEAARRLEPVVRLIERVGNALGIAKRAEEAQPKLPAPQQQKKISPPKQKKGGFDKVLDDEIPF